MKHIIIYIKELLNRIFKSLGYIKEYKILPNNIE